MYDFISNLPMPVLIAIIFNLIAISGAMVVALCRMNLSHLVAWSMFCAIAMNTSIIGTVGGYILVKLADMLGG